MVKTQRIALALACGGAVLGCGASGPGDSGGTDSGEVPLGEWTGDLLMIA